MRRIYMMDVRKYLPELRRSTQVCCSPWCQCECYSIWHKPLTWQILPTRPASDDAHFCRTDLRKWADQKRLRKERTLIVILMLWNLWGAMVYTPGRSTSLRSPNVAKSEHIFWSMLGVWLTSRMSAKEGQIVTSVTLTRLTKSNVESMHFDICLCIYWVRETCKLISDLIT